MRVDTYISIAGILYLSDFERLKQQLRHAPIVSAGHVVAGSSLSWWILTVVVLCFLVRGLAACHMPGHITPDAAAPRLALSMPWAVNAWLERRCDQGAVLFLPIYFQSVTDAHSDIELQRCNLVAPAIPRGVVSSCALVRGVILWRVFCLIKTPQLWSGGKFSGLS